MSAAGSRRGSPAGPGSGASTPMSPNSRSPPPLAPLPPAPDMHRVFRDGSQTIQDMITVFASSPAVAGTAQIQHDIRQVDKKRHEYQVAQKLRRHNERKEWRAEFKEIKDILKTVVKRLDKIGSKIVAVWVILFLTSRGLY